jgi:hypothetical protein
MKTLGDLIGVDLPLLWHEAVAVVQEVASHVTPNGVVPFDSDLLFNEDGTITVCGSGARRVPVVTALGRLLQRLLPADAPVGLRAFASENSSEQPTHPTLEAFTTALAFFERPGRAALLLDVATRLQNYRPTDSTDDELDRLRRKVVDGPEELPVVPAARRPIHLAYAVAGTVALVIVVALAKLRIGPLLAALSSLSIPAMVASTATAPAATDPAKKSVTSADVTNRGTHSPASPRLPADRSRVMPHRAASNAGGAVVASAAQPVGATSPANVNDPGHADASHLQLPTAPAATIRGTTLHLDTARIYTTADKGVTPPTLVYQQLPSEPQPGPTTGVFDLTVDESGNVVTVRLLSPTGRYQDRFLVSAAKAWRFRPALLNGHPVKYRLLVPINLPGQQ